MLTLVTQSLYLIFFICHMVITMITMITTDFMPKNNKKVCENCIHYEECPNTYVCPTLDRIYTAELLEEILEMEE